MKCVLLLHPTLQFYKIPIYNKLADELRKRGVRLIIWYTDIKPRSEKVTFKYLDIPFTIDNYCRVLDEYKVKSVINLLFRRVPGPIFYYRSITIAKKRKLETIYYGHGMNLENLCFAEKVLANLTHLLFSKIILYSPDQIKLLWGVNRRKVSVAFNTLDLEGRRELVRFHREDIRRKLGLTEQTVILFSGRIQTRKRLDVLLEMFKTTEHCPADTALVIIGSGMDERVREEINTCKHVYYLGAIYDRVQMAEIFFASDIFCIPGHLGLGLVEAFYWGLPVLSLQGEHAPEIYYLKQGKNGFLMPSEKSLIRKLYDLSDHADKLEELSANAMDTYDNDATLEQMFGGFYQALEVEG